MDAMMDRIQKLSSERQNLWLQAGRRELGDEEYWRLQQINKELSELWDSYRRQQAAAAWGTERQKAAMSEPEFVSLVKAA